MKRLYLLAVPFIMACGPAYGDSIGVRGAVADTQAEEDFEAYELFVILDLPWAWSQGESRIRTQLEITGGVLDAAGKSGFLGTLGPRIAFETVSVTLDVGIGVAALGETEFGEHDFGSRSQFTAQAGLAVAVLERLNLGVRYRHMSDADRHEGQSLNLLFLELSYEFNE